MNSNVNLNLEIKTMALEKSFQEKFEEIQQKIQLVFSQVLADIAKSPGELERLEMLHANHEKLTKYVVTKLFDSLQL